MSQGAESWQAVHRSLVESLQRLATDASALQEALAGGSLEQAVNALLGRACLAHGLEAAQYVAGLQANPVATRELDRLVGGLLQHPLVAELRRPAALEEVRQQVVAFDAVLSGTADGDPNEIAQLQMVLLEMVQSDPQLPVRVRQAAQKAPPAFGTCEMCQKSIPVGRLRLVPYAERCTPCQVTFEGPALQPPPPVIGFTHFARRPRPAAPPTP